MIHVINKENFASKAHYLAEFAALRHRVFVERLGWDPAPECAARGFEYDRFDSSETVYLVLCDDADKVVAGLRLLKTTRPFVLGECFPELADEAIPRAESIWEVSRFVVDPEVARLTGAHALNSQLIWALHSYGLMAGHTHFVSVSYAGMERLMLSFGCRFRRLGKPQIIEGRRVVALCIEIAEDIVAGMEQRLPGSGPKSAGSVPNIALIAGLSTQLDTARQIPA